MLPTIAFTQTDEEPAAVPSKNMDTLYVQTTMYPIFKEVWDMSNDKIKPVIIPVADTTLYAIKED